MIINELPLNNTNPKHKNNKYRNKPINLIESTNIMEINLEYRKDFYSSDEEMIKIIKYDMMKKLKRKKFDAEQEYKNRIKDIEQEFDIEMNDHQHKYKVSFDAPPYDYGKVCTICGHTRY